MNKLFKLIVFLLYFANTQCLKIDRVIVSTNDNPTYIEFWPIVAKVWKEYMGITPTLALVADKSVQVDETIGEVIRFEPIPGVSTVLHAQAIRLLLPALFEDEVCIISDIDMIPLNKSYFVDSIKNFPEDSFVVYKNGYYEYHKYNFKLPMCYNASKGKNFKEIFKVEDVKDFDSIIKQWSQLNKGWETDELVLYQHLHNWEHYKERCVKLGHFDDRRVDRSHWTYDPAGVKPGSYVDAHCLRPYSKYKKEIDDLVNLLFEDNKNEKQ